MKDNVITITEDLMGTVEYNDGDFAEIQKFGIEGIEACINLDHLQIERSDTPYTIREFRRKFRIGKLLDISTRIEVQPTRRAAHELEEIEQICETEQREFSKFLASET